MVVPAVRKKEWKNKSCRKGVRSAAGVLADIYANMHSTASSCRSMTGTWQAWLHLGFGADFTPNSSAQQAPP